MKKNSERERERGFSRTLGHNTHVSQDGILLINSTLRFSERALSLSLFLLFLVHLTRALYLLLVQTWRYIHTNAYTDLDGSPLLFFSMCGHVSVKKIRTKYTQQRTVLREATKRAVFFCRRVARTRLSFILTINNNEGKTRLHVLFTSSFGKALAHRQATDNHIVLPSRSL